ncbi:MAG: DNA topoisomerase IB [Actinomycetota bacterium]|nr:DNA topoisomerase IB [Actinomycetota bacterium]
MAITTGECAELLSPSAPDDLSARIAELYRDTQACASAAGLVYVTDESPGIRRLRRGRGFGYRDSSNRLLSDAAAKARIMALAIPPAWRNVWICPDDSGHIMAVGEDDRGRKQYIYHARWRELRDLLNFYRLITFGEQLPTIRRYVDSQLRRRTLDRDQVLAAMVRIIDTCAVRIGNEVYAEENDSFGLSTLTKKHVKVSRGQVRMTFPAKSGKKADLVIDDRQIARVITKLEQHRKRRVFTIDGKAVDSAEVNALLEALTDEHITAKDFRTWRGTHAAFRYLEDHLNSTDDPERTALQAIDVAAEILGNTRDVARDHYIHPHVLSAFTDGTFRERLQASAPRRQQLLDGSERRLLAFLKVALDSDLDAASLGLR